jgi:hypothetical protein
VWQRVGGRDGGSLSAVLEDELRQVALNGRVELDAALVEELHHERGGEDLGDGADLKEGVGRGLHASSLVEDPAGALEEVVTITDGERCAGDLIAFAGLDEDAVDVAKTGAEVGRGGGHWWHLGGEWGDATGKGGRLED